MPEPLRIDHPAASAGILAEEPAYDLIELLFFAYRDSATPTASSPTTASGAPITACCTSSTAAPA